MFAYKKGMYNLASNKMVKSAYLSKMDLKIHINQKKNLGKIFHIVSN